ncbi:fumarylacetoacetate hydrolase family protein [Pseudoduganella namucuonensis]|uniref:2-keto-4-pentenoate hydratase/2-oxohepta-3-ene-1,7-dioic acid hydratase (Catechol pathway) n=1 Tax=Pseudoduganella namucuonensis TaxID=1035707 RepID=A0A1I7JVK8_9BURK|nr:fumarylacetoacetate hydrolase family protein [Pseudoduganella namucuonensis]SFU89211.1 2-keto-4-pentenoate hydratase/2-oxohepta-3-ene-1,7-dioic acid hydratase (catechol pathway) [Pseudoduganella namucuonensis]
MKLVRYGRPGKEKPGLIDDEGKLRDLSGVIDDIGPEQLSDKALRKLSRIEPASLPAVRGNPRMGVPVARVGKFIGIGLNYHEHAREMDLPVPKEPIVFMKAVTSLSGADDPVMLAKGSRKTDWEVELGVVIGTRARHVSVEEAEKHIAGYCVVNDVTEREYQLERGGQWDKGKGCDTYGPVGPWLVTRDEVYRPDRLDLYLEVNGKRMQTGSTEDMIFSVPQIVSYLSRFMTLEPGDVIATGTPPGVGNARKPKRFLKKGDFMRLGIAGLGEQQQDVISFQQY